MDIHQQYEGRKGVGGQVAIARSLRSPVPRRNRSLKHDCYGNVWAFIWGVRHKYSAIVVHFLTHLCLTHALPTASVTRTSEVSHEKGHGINHEL